MKKVLITGGSGFIGRNLKEQLADEYNIVALNHQELNLLNMEEVGEFLKKHAFDVVIHSATYNATRNSKENPNLVLKNNLLMFFNLARCQKLFGKMLYFGSGAEYDKDLCPPLAGEDYFNAHIPTDDYGFSKYVCAEIAERSGNIYDLVLFGCFGKYEDWEIRFISNACVKAMFGLDITIKKNAIFDYLYINDLVKIIRRFIELKELKYKRYNVCTGSPMDLLTLAGKVKEISGKNINILIRENSETREYSGDNNRLIKEIGEFEFADIDQSIGALYQWYDLNKGSIDKNLLLTDK